MALLTPRANPGTPENTKTAHFWRELDNRARLPHTGGRNALTRLGQTHRPLAPRPNTSPLSLDPYTAGLTKEDGVDIEFVDTPIPLIVTYALDGPLARANSRSYDFAGGHYILEADSNTPALTFALPGHYLIHGHATIGYHPSCAQPKNLSDATARIRLKIGGTFVESTARYGYLSSKLCATGLVYGVSGTFEGSSGLTTETNPESSGYGQVSGSLPEAAAQKVEAYNRWVGARTTIPLVYQITVIPTATGPRIQTGLRSGSTPPDTVAPTIELYADRSDIEPAPAVAPLADNWLDAASTKLICTDAQLHIVRHSL